MIDRGVGYTILEVLIFIAVSSFILIAAMSMFSGRQQEVQFSQSIREFEASISDIMNDVSTGYFSIGGDITNCSDNSGANLNFENTGTRENNRNSECIYIGKVLQFFPKATDTSSADFSKFNVYNLVGRRLDDSGNLVTNFNDAKGQIEGNSSTSANPIVEEYSLKFGIEAYKIIKTPSAPPNPQNTFDGFVVMSDLSGAAVTSNTNNSQTVKLGGIWGDSSNTLSGKSSLQFRAAYTDTLVEDNLTSFGSIRTDLAKTNGIVICLRDDEDRKASLTIGANGGNSTNLRIDDYEKDCDNS